MLRTAFLTLVALAIALAGGGTSVWYALKAREGVGAVTFGEWTAFPDAGTPDADPYAKARIAREGILALGRAEGLAFTAQRDSGGEALRRECSYKLEGPVPSARLWTLHAVDAAGALVASQGGRAPALHSLQLLRNADDTVVVSAGPLPAPGNWLALSGRGPMRLVLTLYDTPIAASTGVSDIELPQICGSTAMLRLAYAVLVGLVGAGIVHIAVLMLLPEFSDRDAWSRLALAAHLYRPVRIDAEPGDAAAFGALDPLFDAAACRFDLAEGMVHVRAPGKVPFWSVSVYDRGGQNIYSFNDRTATAGRLDFVVLTPPQMIEVRKELPAAFEGSVFVETTVGEGIVVVRTFVPDPSWRAAVSAFLGGLGCALG